VCVKGRASEPHPREVHFNMTGNANDGYTALFIICIFACQHPI